jgi:hypothetical protein
MSYVLDNVTRDKNNFCLFVFFLKKKKKDSIVEAYYAFNIAALNISCKDC